MATSSVGEALNTEDRRKWAEDALRAAAKAAQVSGQVPADLVEPTGWRWRVLHELDGLSTDLVKAYRRANKRQSHQAWESRWGGPLATGGGAAVGSVVSAVGAGVIKTNAAAGWALVIVGVLIAVVGSVFSANTYVQNRNKKLRYLRLLYDIWDYAFAVLPSAQASDAYNAVDSIRSLWETAGT
jgi:hypothetical protein